MKTFLLESDGTLVVSDLAAHVDALGKPVLDALGNPELRGVVMRISQRAIGAYRLDDSFEQALRAAAGTPGNLSAAELAALPARGR